MKLDNYYIADNLEFLNKIEDKSVDLCYIDPPFATNRDFGDFKDLWKDPQIFCDEFLAPRLELIKTKLKVTGNLVLHCDTSASHYIKVLLDNIFKRKNFKNEIIWVTGGNAKATKKFYKTHDVLFVYAVSNNSKFNAQYTPYDEEYYEKNNIQFCDIHNEAYITCAIHSSQPEVSPRPNLRYNWNGHDKQWLVEQKKLKQLHEDNRLQYGPKGVPRVKRFLSEMGGIPIKDVWMDINSIQSGEKLNYATQKPVKLLERIVTTYTDPKDIVLDCFAGSGTTGRACVNLNRHYLLVDKNKKGKELFFDSIKKSLAYNLIT
ncbi:MAG: hypothetical protein DRO67_01840 [Candidatus Asgardarchaeum californiense]|nr:MAG: hypothetical protein DRO67_01840 [Candidatus Asgardarchaeum californiense]